MTSGGHHVDPDARAGIGALIGVIEDLTSRRILSRGAGRSLVCTLHTAIWSLDNEGSEAGAAHVSIFIRQVEALEQLRHLGEADSQPLVAAAESVAGALRPD